MRRSGLAQVMHVAVATIVSLGGGCAGHHVESSPHAALGAAPAEPIHSIPDRAYFHGVADRAQAIRDTFQAVATSTLSVELDRTSCERSLPRPLTTGPSWAGEELYAQRAPGVLVLATFGKCFDPACQYRGHAAMKSTASAFALTADGVCVSNYHVFEDGSDEEFMVAATQQGVVYSVVEVLAASKHDDIAIFQIDTRGDELSPIPLRGNAPVGIDVHVISHPEEHVFTMTRGILARRSAMRGDLGHGDHTSRGSPPKAISPNLPIEPDHDAELAQAIEITAEFAIGSSGGPVLDDRGNAVGMVCATTTLYADRENRADPQAVLRVCVPAESVLRLVKRPAD